MAKKTPVPRVNIYLPDPIIRRQIKTAAAKQDMSVSEYCLRAITTQLVRDRERSPVRWRRHQRETAVDAARRFQAEVFEGRVFTVSSAELIRDAREDLSTR